MNEQHLASESIERVDPIARVWRRVANALTVGRTIVASAVCLNAVAGIEAMPEAVERLQVHGLEFHSLGIAGAFAVCGAMDKLDGGAARAAGKRGLHPTYRDMKRDPLHDKIYAYMAMSTAAIMLTAEGCITRDHSKIATGAGIVANMAAVVVRDIKMTHSRNHVADGVKPEAIKINKLKTGAQNVAHTLVASPLPSWVSWPAYSVITGWSWLGYKIADRVHKGEEYPGFMQATKRVLLRSELELAA